MNAIPRESSATIGIPKNEKDNFLKFKEDFRNRILERFPEERLSMESIESEKSNYFLDKKSQRSVLNSLYRVPHGVINFSPEADVVETSNNLATIKTKEGKVVAGTSQRSSSDKIRDATSNYIKKLFEHEGGEVEHVGHYPSWEPNTNSEMLEKSKEVYKNRFEEEPKVKVIHGGLECGPIYNKYPHLDIISFGPTIKNPHSPDEMVEINSVGKFWDFLKDVLENVPEKN